MLTEKRSNNCAMQTRTTVCVLMFGLYVVCLFYAGFAAFVFCLCCVYVVSFMLFFCCVSARSVLGVVCVLLLLLCVLFVFC